MKKTNKEVLTSANEAVSIGDYEGFLQYCTEDTEWTFVGDRVLTGKKKVREWMHGEYREPPKLSVTKLIAESEFVTALGEITLVDEEGESVHYDYCDVWKFREGKMAELTAFVIEAGRSAKDGNQQSAFAKEQ